MERGNLSSHKSSTMKAKVTRCPRDFFATSGYHPVRTLGKGMMGQVVLARSRDCSEYTAVKTFTKKTLDGGKDNFKMFVKEVTILQCSKHKNILGNVKAFDCPGEYTLCMPYYKNGVLTSILPSITFDLTEKYIQQLSSAIQYLHSRHVVHRDIKPDNVLISDDRNDVILTDFGLSSMSKSKDQSRVRPLGTIAYMSPEFLRQMANNWIQNIDLYKCDMYALGVVFWNMVFRRLAPPEGTSYLSFLHTKKYVQTSYKEVLEHLLNEDASTRWDSNQLASTLSNWTTVEDSLEEDFN